MNINDTIALTVFFGIFVVGMILACVFIIGTKIANKNLNSKFSKWWYEH